MHKSKLLQASFLEESRHPLAMANDVDERPVKVSVGWSTLL